jgi:hypothetical protein
MATVGKCPKCGRGIGQVLFEVIVAQERPHGNAWNALSFLCPSCYSVLGVQVDPVALNSDLVEQLAERLRKD